MNRRDALKGLACVPVVAAVGLGAEKRWGLLTNVKASRDAVYEALVDDPYVAFDFGSEDWTMVVYYMKKGDYVHFTEAKVSATYRPCIITSRTLDGVELELKDGCRISGKVGRQRYENVRLYNCPKLKVVA